MAGLPPTHTIEFVAGDVLKFRFQVTDKDMDDPDAVPVPRDLTGYTVLSQVRQTATSADILATWELVGTLGDDGIISMRIDGPDTQTWSAIKTMVSDIQVTDTAGDPETVLSLVINAAQDVTREVLG